MKLTNLRELNLGYNNSLKEVPLGSNGLPNLRFLGLLGCNKLCLPFHQLISKVPKVECLELGYGVTNILGKDLMKVEHLTRVQECWMSDVSDFTSYIKSKHYHQLRGYQFYVGPTESVISQIDHLFDNNVVINGYSLNKAGEDEALILPNTIQLLQLIHADFSIRNLTDVLPSLHGLTTLSRIWLGYCDGLEFIWPSISCSVIELKSLKELNLVELPNFRGITESGAPPVVTLHNLKKLTVEYCSNIHHLFMPEVLNQLQSLEVLEIQVCAQLEMIIAESVDAEPENCRVPTTIDSVNDVIFLPKLRNLRLIYLPNLVNICSKGLLSSDLIEEMVIVSCPNLMKTIPLSIPLIENGKPCTPLFLRKLILDKEWWESLEWDHPDFKWLLQPFVQFPDGSSATT